MMLRDSCQKVNAVSGKVQNIQRNSIKGKCRVFVSLPDRFQNKLYKDTMKEELCQGNKAESPSEDSRKYSKSVGAVIKYRHSILSQPRFMMNEKSSGGRAKGGGRWAVKRKNHFTKV